MTSLRRMIEYHSTPVYHHTQVEGHFRFLVHVECQDTCTLGFLRFDVPLHRITQRGGCELMYEMKESRRSGGIDG